MKTFKEFLRIREGLWSVEDKAPHDRPGTKRPPQKTDSSRYDGSNAGGGGASPGATPMPSMGQMPQMPPKKAMKKK